MNYPTARRESTTDTVGGIAFEAPYLWLEEDSDEALAWQAAQDALLSERPVTLDWAHASPDGSLVAYGLSEHGDEQSTLHVLETATRRVLPERIPYTLRAAVAWLPDSSGFYYNARRGLETRDMRFLVFFHRPGEAPPGEPEPPAAREWLGFLMRHVGLEP
ncbi:MAG: hypothetical protein V3V67_04025 [Myxococcota bacterium]